MTDWLSSAEFALRATPVRPYVPGDQVLEISNDVLDATFQAHSSFLKLRVESCCFWYGIELSNTVSRVTAVVVPRQSNSWGNYHVSSQAIAEVARTTKSLGLRNLSQIHTHPGQLVEHSLYDDRMANSRRALSLVLPFYGIPNCVWPDDIGIHEFQEDYWYRLSIKQAARRVLVVGTYASILQIDLQSR